MGGTVIMKLGTKKKERMNLATEILNDMKRQLIRCRVALILSLAVNIIQVLVLIFG